MNGGGEGGWEESGRTFHAWRSSGRNGWYVGCTFWEHMRRQISASRNYSVCPDEGHWREGKLQTRGLQDELYFSYVILGGLGFSPYPSVNLRRRSPGLLQVWGALTTGRLRRGLWACLTPTVKTGIKRPLKPFMHRTHTASLFSSRFLLENAIK